MLIIIQFNSLPVIPLRVTSVFGKRNTGIKGASTFHKGIDLGRDKSKTITNIYSVADGVVYSNCWNKYRGWVIIIQHAGFKTLYQHLAFQPQLKKGTSIKSGQKIGEMGNSSDKSVLNVSIHLHFELIVNEVQIDPSKYLNNANLALKVKIKFNLSDDTIEYLAKYDFASSLFDGLLNGKKDFSDDTIGYIKKYQYGIELVKRLGVI